MLILQKLGCYGQGEQNGVDNVKTRNAVANFNRSLAINIYKSGLTIGHKIVGLKILSALYVTGLCVVAFLGNVILHGPVITRSIFSKIFTRDAHDSPASEIYRDCSGYGRNQ